MKVLNLIIKQKYFDEILAGTKKEEYREVRPTTFKKYLRYEVDGELYEDLKDVPKEKGEDFDFEAIPIEYDALRLYVGYNKDRDSMLVKVENTILEYLVDDNDEYISYEYKGDEYLVCQMVYELGEIIETNIHPKKK